MQIILNTIQIILAVSLTLMVLVQSKGTGLGRAWGGGGQVSFSRRGVERVLFKSTFVVSALFIAVSLLQLFV